MTIEFKICISEPNVLNKVLVDVAIAEGTLRNESPISNPSIIVERNAVKLGELFNANYAHIPEFHRYYYITEVTQIREGIWRVDMRCDPLMSFATGIKASMVLVEETTEAGIANVNNYMANDSFVNLVKDKTDIVQFPEGFNDSPYFILITAGGIVS